MKLLFASDIHGSAYYNMLLMDKFKEEKADKLILLGDLLYHGPRNPLPKDYNPMKVAETLNKYKDKIIAVRGNCDSEVDQMVLEFHIRSDYTQVLVDNYTFFLTHGHLFNPKGLKLGENTIYVFGHIHLPVLEKQEIYVLNPGSISLPKDGKVPTYAIYENNTIQIKDFNANVIKELKL